VICALLFLATTVNYVDRQILGILAAPLQREIGWSESQYGLIVTAFQTAYAIGLPAFGRLIDVIGARAGYALAVAWWSLAAAGHALARSPLGFGLARFLLGFGEAGNFPAAVKTVAEWFPRQERALAVGLFNCGSNIGAIVTPLLVPWLAITYGWRWAFAVTGLAGLLWLIAWFALSGDPRTHRRLSESERRHILAGREESAAPLPWSRLLAYRQTWALVVARFLTDPVWWFYLYWGPKYLNAKQGVTLEKIGLPLVVMYLAADAGSIFGGWLSSSLMKRGWSVNAARKAAVLACALMVTPMAFAARTGQLRTAVLVLSLAAAGHQGWAANMFAMISDIYPQRAVSTVTGIAGLGGSLGGMLISAGIGFILEATGSYVPMFLWAGVSYLVILTVIHAMIPNIGPLEPQEA
jgi:ACS family hexuronate transporter-like MFS transporter